MSSRGLPRTEDTPPSEFDSSLEAAIAKKFGRKRAGWRLIREGAVSPFFAFALAAACFITYTHSAKGLVPTMVGPNPMQPPTRYLVPDDRDFFAVYEPTPGPVSVPLK